MATEEPASSQDVGLIEKAFLMGLGAAALAKEKAEELAEEMIQRGKLTREQSGNFVSRLVEQAEEAGETAKATAQRQTERAITGVGLASAKDVEEIRAELTEIKAMIASMRPVKESTQEGEV